MMEDKKIYSRWAEKALLKRLNFMRIICVLGARQTGKSTMLQNSALQNAVYKTLDNQAERLNAEDPMFFLSQNRDGLLIIDEVQREPELILALKQVVDCDTRPGQFVITGSADYRNLPNANESLAGRAGIVKMRPLSQAEIRGAEPDFLKKLFNRQFTLNVKPEPLGKIALFDLVIRGGFPEVQLLSNNDFKHWFKTYVHESIYRELVSINKIRKSPKTVHQTIGTLALSSCSPKNFSVLADYVGLTRDTMENYCRGLETLFLMSEIPAWNAKPTLALAKKSKLVFADSGLMAYFMNINTPKQILDGMTTGDKRWGKLVETWVYNQIAPEIDLHTNWRLSHLRARENQEIDFLIENENGDLLGIEVKAAESLKADDFKTLKWFEEKHDGPTHFTGVVLYAGHSVIRISESLWGIPMSLMWS